METFPIVKRKEYGDYRTRRTILVIYDEMAAAMNPTLALPSLGREQSRGYQTRLDLPPADARVAHPPR